MNKKLIVSMMFLMIGSQILPVDFDENNAWYRGQEAGVSSEVAVRALSEFPSCPMVADSFRQNCKEDKDCLKLINSFIAAQQADRANKTKVEKNIQTALNGPYRNYFDNPAILNNISYQVASKDLVAQVLADQLSPKNRTIFDTIDLKAHRAVLIAFQKGIAACSNPNLIIDAKDKELIERQQGLIELLLAGDTPAFVEKYVEFSNNGDLAN